MPRSSPSTVSIFRSSFFFLLHVGEKTECQLRNLVSTQFLSRRAVNETRAVSFRWAVSFSQGRVESNSTVSAISAMPSNSRWTTVEFHQCQTAYGFSWRLARLVMCILFTVRTWISLQVFRHLPNNWIERFVSFFLRLQRKRSRRSTTPVTIPATLWHLLFDGWSRPRIQTVYLCCTLQWIPVDANRVVRNLLDASNESRAVFRICQKKNIFYRKCFNLNVLFCKLISSSTCVVRVHRWERVGRKVMDS